MYTTTLFLSVPQKVQVAHPHDDVALQRKVLSSFALPLCLNQGGDAITILDAREQAVNLQELLPKRRDVGEGDRGLVDVLGGAAELVDGGAAAGARVVVVDAEVVVAGAVQGAATTSERARALHAVIVIVIGGVFIGVVTATLLKAHETGFRRHSLL